MALRGCLPQGMIQSLFGPSGGHCVERNFHYNFIVMKMGPPEALIHKRDESWPDGLCLALRVATGGAKSMQICLRNPLGPKSV